ncbi:DUF2062 domain-containing protein [Algibacter sp.]|nr:DUF2062 domain-containing protein [Algibacter sp.]
MNFLNRIWQKIKALLKQGLTPKQLALSLVISTLVSIFPIYGISTIILTCIALPLRLNLPIMIAFSYVAETLKLLVLIPFINLGGYIFGTEHTLLTFEAIKTSYQSNFWQTAQDLSYELLCGAVGWTLTAIPLGIILYFLLKGVFIYFDRLRNNQLSTK